MIRQYRDQRRAGRKSNMRDWSRVFKKGHFAALDPTPRSIESCMPLSLLKIILKSPVLLL